MSDLNDAIRAINYWDREPKSLGFIRDDYLEVILDHLGSNLLKVLIGQRRCGKSFLLRQTIASLLSNNVPNKNILYLNFELHQLQLIQESSALAEVIDYYIKTQKPEGKIYLFFDEIQEVENWERVINSYLADESFTVEIIITGSNAHLLSTELSTYVTGRYIEIPIYPFSYSEYLKYNDGQPDKATFINFIESSGIPETFNLKDKKQKTSYLMSLKDSILINDIVKRFNIKNPKLLSLILDFLIDNIGHLFSVNSIANKLKSCGVNINAVTLGNYIHYLEMTFLVYGVSRYDLRGKKILEGERKYYLNDLGFANYLQSTFDSGITRKLENYVFNALIQAGYSVRVGYIYHLEIDFVAERNDQVIYIQVTYLLQDESVIEREYGNLEKIRDNWPKWVVSMDEIKIPSKDGILHVPAWQLMEKITGEKD